MAVDRCPHGHPRDPAGGPCPACGAAAGTTAVLTAGPPGGQLVPGQTVLAVRVDPADHSKVAVDFASEVPNVKVAAGTGHDSAKWILENGTEANVVLVANQPIGVTSAAGDPVHALTLTIDKGAESYQVQVGNGVPNSALPLLFPGSKLYAKIGDGPNDVVVDWARGARA